MASACDHNTHKLMQKHIKLEASLGCHGRTLPQERREGKEERGGKEGIRAVSLEAVLS